MKPRPWTPTEDKLIEELYPCTPGPKLAKMLNRPAYTICKRAHKLGVRRNFALLEPEFNRGLTFS